MQKNIGVLTVLNKYVTLSNMTEKEILSLLSKRYCAPEYAFFPHVKNQTGYEISNERIADGLAMSLYPSRGLYLHGFEVKCSIGDLQTELKNPDKAEEIAKYCHFWWIVTPKDMIDPKELPENWGLLEADSIIRIKKKANILDPKIIDIHLVASILRRASQYFVPKDQIDNLVKEREERRYTEDKMALDNLRTKLGAFEYESGIKIDAYHRGNIAAAVKTVLDYQGQMGEDNLNELVNYAENVYIKGRMLQSAFETKRNKEIKK